jgi:hypothetical protein
MTIKKFRDLTVIHQPRGGFLVAACDSCGGVGPKHGDALKTDGYTVGYTAAAVVLMELISAGTVPFFLADGLAVEENPTGREILRGIRAAAEEAGIAKEGVTGSTEENFPTLQTGLGITGLGWTDTWPVYQSTPGDLLILAGRPLWGDALLEASRKDFLSLPTLKKLRTEAPFTELIGEILPVGSRGALLEAKELASSAGCVFHPEDNLPDSLKGSGGPASCAILSVKPENLRSLSQAAPLPLILLGRLDLI